MRYAVDQLAASIDGRHVDAICCIDARGFLFGAPVGVQLGLPIVPVRKGGKLPPETVGADYDLEYGKARLEARMGALRPGQRVVIIDDLLATGGTASATGKLIEKLGAEVDMYAFVVELTALNGRKALAPVEAYSLVQY
jgi:adenine phosphoribosyltransferase